MSRNEAEENEAHEVASVIETTRQRQEKNEFTLVRPCELKISQDEEAANVTLGLTEKLEW